MLLALAGLAAGCASTPQPKAAARGHDAASLTALAEMALKQGDCKGASESYAKAAAVGDAALAQRASKVALACEHLPAAWQAVTRWKALAPGDREATAMYAAVALKQYRLPEARAAISEFSHEKAPAGSKSDGLGALSALLLQESDASTVLSVMSGALESQGPSPDTLALLGDLSLNAFDAGRAERYAQGALEQDPKNAIAIRVLARAYVMRGDAPRAIAAARQAMSANPVENAFALADVFADLDRVEEAHQELDRLRNSPVPSAEVDRRLALLAFDSGDLEEAGHRFAELVTSGEATDSALLFLADIAARDGDTDAALAGYRKLADSSVALSARSRAAALLMARKDRAGALAMLDDYAASHPESGFDLTLAKARLLADNGDADTGLSVLRTALEQHPDHPSIEYDRAVILEQAGRVHESVQVLERLLARRPDDPVLSNALGYTLAEHSLQLPRAETLIRAALARTPDSPAVLDSLGWVRYREGDPKDAVPMLARAYSIQHDAEIAAHWGEALWASGEQQDARRVWAAALARDPSSQPLKATLGRFIPGAGGGAAAGTGADAEKGARHSSGADADANASAGAGRSPPRRHPQ